MNFVCVVVSVVFFVVVVCIRRQDPPTRPPAYGYPAPQPQPYAPQPAPYPQAPQPYPPATQPQAPQPYPPATQPQAPQPAPSGPAPTQPPADPWTTLLGQVPPLPSGWLQLPPGWTWPSPQGSGSSPAPAPSSSSLPPIPPRALELANAINAYRQQNGLPPVPITRALTHVAETHVRDLASSPKRPGCNGHSWTERGAWTACCYTPDHAQAKCMWSKPAELTPFGGTGFEITVCQPGESTGYALDAKRALDLWKSSPLHNDVILNRESWKSVTWSAMGAGIIDSHASAWFAREPDPNP